VASSIHKQRLNERLAHELLARLDSGHRFKKSFAEGFIDPCPPPAKLITLSLVAPKLDLLRRPRRRNCRPDRRPCARRPSCRTIPQQPEAAGDLSVGLVKSGFPTSTTSRPSGGPSADL
jgi:hypothetical protein